MFCGRGDDAQITATRASRVDNERIEGDYNISFVRREPEHQRNSWATNDILTRYRKAEPTHEKDVEE